MSLQDDLGLDLAQRRQDAKASGRTRFMAIPVASALRALVRVSPHDATCSERGMPRWWGELSMRTSRWCGGSAQRGPGTGNRGRAGRRVKAPPSLLAGFMNYGSTEASSRPTFPGRGRRAASPAFPPSRLPGPGRDGTPRWCEGSVQCEPGQTRRECGALAGCLALQPVKPAESAAHLRGVWLSTRSNPPRVRRTYGVFGSPGAQGAEPQGVVWTLGGSARDQTGRHLSL